MTTAVRAFQLFIKYKLSGSDKRINYFSYSLHSVFAIGVILSKPVIQGLMLRMAGK
jgi:hypothetical protein